MQSNVAHVMVKFSEEANLGPIDGYGFLIGQQGNKYYIITAWHTVEPINNQVPAITIQFRDQKTPVVASVVDHWNEPLDEPFDLAILEIQMAPYVWRKYCASFVGAKLDQKPTFMAWQSQWRDYPPALDVGRITKSEENDPFIRFEHKDVAVGASGSPLITDKGIIGMILNNQDGGRSTALSIIKIRSLLEEKHSDKFQLKPIAFRDQMVLIPGTTFEMGSRKKEASDIVPTHPVTLSPFYIDKYELSFKEYNIYLKDSSKKTFDNRSENDPVINITWWDAIKFCNWLSIEDGYEEVYEFVPGGELIVHWKRDGYRLPTESEWEYAASGGFNKYSTEVKNTPLPKRKAPQQVTTGSPNAFELFHMNDNVAEWCWDYYNEKTYQIRNSDRNLDPRGPDIGSKRVVRGGNWADKNFKFYLRRSYPANANYPKVGLRLVRNG
ncbi:SUMF1/EgtB/PvdO family nonheme iron enzyme [Haliscomenobacter hydrossis]|uniref:SUMF1/EgtB/PvdO family nonheme iron enzyme n=1 Tax=Haliscomenobacter hydrossis TaxID=2350 RepID=UPI00145F5F6E|nr:SUMF1/EgtB/PvdO family nonheme iron enzyme [Haliscomenobacter hydrossis]